MKTSETRNYNCKDEELPTICRNALFCLKRDLADFAAFSPVFSEDYVNTFTDKINRIDELVLPKTETDELKKITKRLYLTMDNLLEPIAKIRGYLFLAKDTVGTSAKDFGLSVLNRKIANRDSEGVRQNLLIVNSFLEKYREQLVAVGFSDAIIEQFNVAVSSITDDNQLQFNIVSKRKIIVQDNISALNDLYAQLMNILNIGKSLYKNTNPLKSKEYTYNSLKKSVRTKN
ncbi:MAG: hypothetical protein LBS55_00670 [Prevotellaceae bacterium]|jgi:hypothetical protein|nr:hypothetical protein [Prevotellaceae bacterium]